MTSSMLVPPVRGMWTKMHRCRWEITGLLLKRPEKESRLGSLAVALILKPLGGYHTGTVGRSPSDTMGPDLSALVRAWPASLVSITEITGLPSRPGRRASFRLEFSDGATVKGRRFETPERATRVTALLRLMGDGFPRVLDARGDSLLLEWIHGPALDSLQPIPPDILTRSGELLGALHRLQPDHPVPAPLDGLGERRSRLEKNTALLGAEGVLDPGLGEVLLDAAAAGAPTTATSGLIHKDLCPSNIVLRDHIPVPIDNASLALGLHDLDLARTWYRWPMTRPEWRHFADGYERHRRADGFVDHFVFWAVSVLVGSAAVRVRARSSQARVPLQRLRRILDALSDGTEADPVAVGWPESTPSP